MISKHNTEIREQHYWDAEGAEDFEPTKEQIKSFLKDQGYAAEFITIFFDQTQKFWRWYCDIKALNKEGQ